ncbi:AAA family ATPase [Massilia sp. NR 4-1]|uniref:AAA family ATPase n=1 Tax=Massilia sp. NR 4-1 TaxID=1678028 RepID=UPI00067BC44B|nr:AAA family ATPase [Massilia sp. NR 4-1]AKU20351.1 response regulator receiver protein [Massilia sp. NR 4-1]
MKITVISANEKLLLDIARVLRERSMADQVDAVAGPLDKLQAMDAAHAPSLLVLAQPVLSSGELERLESLAIRHPGMAILLLCQLQTPEFLLQAMRAGVREVLPLPADPAQLHSAVRRIEDKLNVHKRAQGKVLAFVSCKGGSGATFLAANLGYALAAAENKRVALFDLNLQFGDASLFISDQKPVASLAQLSQQIHRLDASFLASSMVQVTPNFGVLAAPEDPAQANDVHPEHIDVLLKLARQHYDFILLDVGRSLDAISVRALDQADMIFPILQATLPYIRDGKRLLNVFRSLDYRKDKIHLIVNRYANSGEIRLRDCEQAYGTTMFRTIPNHYEAAAASVNQGVPILQLQRNSPVSKALQEMARELAGESAAEARGWLSRILQRA